MMFEELQEKTYLPLLQNAWVKPTPLSFAEKPQ